MFFQRTYFLLCFLLGCILSLQTLVACGSPTSTDEVVIKGEFADVVLLDNRQKLQDFLKNNQLDEVYPCSDPIADEKVMLVIPATDEVKLALYALVTDAYGNVEPDYDNCRGEAQPGQALYFVCNLQPGEQFDSVVEAVNGIGQRQSWCPKLDKQGRLGIDEDFGNAVNRTVESSGTESAAALSD